MVFGFLLIEFNSLDKGLPPLQLTDSYILFQIASDFFTLFGVSSDIISCSSLIFFSIFFVSLTTLGILISQSSNHVQWTAFQMLFWFACCAHRCQWAHWKRFASDLYCPVKAVYRYWSFLGYGDHASSGGPHGNKLQLAYALAGLSRICESTEMLDAVKDLLKSFSCFVGWKFESRSEEKKRWDVVGVDTCYSARLWRYCFV